MKILKVVSVFVSLCFVLGCEPEIYVPNDFSKYIELRNEDLFISEGDLMSWLGEPDRVIKVKDVISTIMTSSDYDNVEDRNVLEESLKHCIDSWYFEYADVKNKSIENFCDWSSDEVFMDTEVLGYYFDHPIEIKLGYSKWIGTYKQFTDKLTFFFIKIDGRGFLALKFVSRK